ncbi:TPA: hypothetical protein TY768_000933 [Streptococcus suis]|nr:hypothetical protein [Streptococcus suis]
MKLNDPIITEIEFDDRVYPIDLSFNKVLDVFDVINDDLLMDFEKASICLEILLGDVALSVSETIDLWVYIKKNFIDAPSKEEQLFDIDGNPMPSPKKSTESKKLIDFVKDAEFIFASFLQAYGINLLKSQNKLTWAEFRALLNALPEDTIMQRIIEIRDWTPQPGESTKYREQMRKAQQKYRLDEGEEEEDG